MRMYDLIKKKRDGESLTSEEINFMILEYTKDEIPDYQMSAMLMAIYFQGMSKEETLALTMAMKNSGDCLDLSFIKGITVDKHSTGGVGDKTSLVLTPMVAACGVHIAKMSGRGLGHTGGTIDKLESFPGFSTSISIQEFEKNINTIGVSIIGQTVDLAPADKKLYALRDVTATVDSIPLIASSIMSKKLAAGADAIVLDVKTGSGAFMKSLEDAERLAIEMVHIGKGAKRDTVAIISDMDQPLGMAVGNAIEVIEAINTLNGNGPKDLYELCITLGSYMLVAAKIANSVDEAILLLEDAIISKKALHKFAEFIEAQGGDPSYVYDTSKFKLGEIKEYVFSANEGYIEHIECDEIGICSLLLGGGRETKESEIDLSVGLLLHKKVGDYIRKGDILSTIIGNEEHSIIKVKERLANAYTFSAQKVESPQLIKKIIQ